MFDKILIAHDGSEGARRAFDTAVGLAVATNAKLHMITIEEDLPPCAETMTEGGELRTRVKQNLAQFTAHARQRAALRSVELESTILPGHAVKTIVEFAKQNEFDLVVVGFTGRSGIFDHLWGGDSQNLARLAPCSVLVVK